MASLDPNTEKFYIGKYLSEISPKIDREAYSLPLEEPTSFGIVQPNYQALKETSNVEDLRANPEDFNILPEDVQAGCDNWSQVNIVATSGEFERNPVPNFGFYGFYFGYLGRGREQQLIAIAISDFYILGIESGSDGKEILNFA